MAKPGTTITWWPAISVEKRTLSGFPPCYQLSTDGGPVNAIYFSPKSIKLLVCSSRNGNNLIEGQVFSTKILKINFYQIFHKLIIILTLTINEESWNSGRWLSRAARCPHNSNLMLLPYLAIWLSLVGNDGPPSLFFN